MKSCILLALALLPSMAMNAEARSGRHHHGHSFRHHHHHRQAVLSESSTHDRSPSVPEGKAAIFAMVTRSAIEHGLPPALAHGIVRVESGYRCDATHAGAIGIMQIKTATARSVGIAGGLRSCSQGLEAGMRYLRQAYDLARGNPAYAATLYNRGLAARPARSGYSRSVMRVSAL